MRLLFSVLLILWAVNALAAPPIQLPPACALVPSEYSGDVQTTISLSINVSHVCGSISIEMDCANEGLPDVYELIRSEESCGYTSELFYANCTYNASGEFLANASLEAPAVSLECGVATVDVSCGNDQTGFSCGEDAFCCSGGCSGYPSECGACGINTSYVCSNQTWLCEPLANGTVCNDVCGAQNLSTHGTCQGGECVATVSPCTLETYCDQGVCGSGLFACTFNGTSAQFEWSLDGSQCAGQPVCPGNACVSVGGGSWHYAFTEGKAGCSLESDRCRSPGCCSAVCDPVKGCSQVPGACQDSCTSQQLKIAGECLGCAAVSVSSSCNYREWTCNSGNSCQFINCGGIGYSCERVGLEWQWTSGGRGCLTGQPGITVAPLPPSEDPAFYPGALPAPSTYTLPSATWDATPLPPNTAVKKEVRPTIIPELEEIINSILVLEYYFSPEVIDSTRKTRVFVFTDSESRLAFNLPCKGPSTCICRPPFDGTHSNFICEIFPPVNGTYAIRLSNALNESGVFVARLIPGEEAFLYTVYIPPRPNAYIVYGALLAVAGLLGYGFLKSVRSYRKRAKEPALLEAERVRMENEKQDLKYRLLKRQVSQDVYRSKMLANERKLTEIKSRLETLNKQRASYRVRRLFKK